MVVVDSVNGVPIRITQERLDHIISRHPEMKGHSDAIKNAISGPDFVQTGDFGELLSIKKMPPDLPAKYVVAVYREINHADGFLITAYFTRKPAEWRTTIWKR
jgi:hypothetical protein